MSWAPEQLPKLLSILESALCNDEDFGYDTAVGLVAKEAKFRAKLDSFACNPATYVHESLRHFASMSDYPIFQDCMHYAAIQFRAEIRRIVPGSTVTFATCKQALRQLLLPPPEPIPLPAEMSMQQPQCQLASGQSTTPSGCSAGQSVPPPANLDGFPEAPLAPSMLSVSKSAGPSQGAVVDSVAPTPSHGSQDRYSEQNLPVRPSSKQPVAAEPRSVHAQVPLDSSVATAHVFSTPVASADGPRTVAEPVAPNANVTLPAASSLSSAPVMCESPPEPYPLVDIPGVAAAPDPAASMDGFPSSSSSIRGPDALFGSSARPASSASTSSDGGGTAKPTHKAHSGRRPVRLPSQPPYDGSVPRARGRRLCTSKFLRLFNRRRHRRRPIFPAGRLPCGHRQL
ncbi:hypothetical protein Agub_g8395 [Astrephomene gubernaculifera]|uniref:Uncharacterized protein n=1 Tax=Astrephomene gubernaculifera TaxID=47775 RepID=A0AAD3DU97_9CHLO|nr:hypothetical protein Agub_g8395 [Astrephomene gubernaculifera]